ncbi:MAG: hypothetical protein NUV73_02295 [Candidatus Daviesbacteria bacterium]|nr:hypothetical protein [Candidatus Daviesbacteria bacterium]
MAVNLLVLGILIYLLWAMFHHKKNKSLTLPVFIEYLLTAALVLILISGVIF